MIYSNLLDEYSDGAPNKSVAPYISYYNTGFCLLSSSTRAPAKFSEYFSSMLPLQLVFTFLALACFQAAASQQNTRRVGLSVSVGCGKLLPHGQALGTVSNISISSGGFQRSYLVFIPPKYNAFIPTPLILSYHGGVRSAMDQLELDQLTSSEFNTQLIVVYPQGINVSIL
jgi:poly(3-hydroxybutyrate) depolymerase